MSELAPCPECQRHVRKSETRCPFCGEAVSLAHLPPPPLPGRRLGRAATFAFGATVVGATALVACSDGSDEVTNVMPVYGAPGIPPGGGAGVGGSAVYGAPPSGGVDGAAAGSPNQESGGQGGAAAGAGGAPAGDPDTNVGGVDGSLPNAGAGGA
jgi:hypothetical protein